MKTRTLSFIVALAAVASAHAQLNPGKFVLDVSPVVARPIDLAWATYNQTGDDGSTSWQKVFDNNIILGHEYPEASIIHQKLGGYWSYAENSLIPYAVALGTQVESIHAAWEPLQVRWFARYVPAANETPVSPDHAVVLQGHARECIHNQIAPWFDPGWAHTYYFNGMALGNPLVDNTDDFGGTPGYTTYEIGQQLVWSGGISNVAGQWILRATDSTLGHIFNTQHAKAYYDQAVLQMLTDTTVYKVTWIDYRQVDRGFLLGDIDGDGEVGPSDFGRLSAAYGSTPEDSNWDAFANLDGDPEIGPGDFGLLANDYGKTTFNVLVEQLNKDLDFGFW